MVKGIIGRPARPPLTEVLTMALFAEMRRGEYEFSPGSMKERADQ